MSMLGVQSVVARLCLVREFRRAWAADPAAAMRALPLTDDERKMVRGLDVGVVAAFGNNLIQKRIGMMREWFPHTFTAMDHELSRHVTTCHLERYTQTHVREGDEYAGRWMRRESERLASYLLEIVTHDVVPLPALKDVIRFERERLRVMIDPDSARSMLKSADDRVWNVGVTHATEVVRPRHVTLLETDYNVPLLTELIQRGTSLRTAGAKRSWILYIRRGPTSVETFAGTVYKSLKDSTDFVYYSPRVFRYTPFPNTGTAQPDKRISTADRPASPYWQKDVGGGDPS